MKITYMKTLKKKLKMSDELLEMTYELMEKLRMCGYISNNKEMDLVDLLCKNVSKVTIGAVDAEDLKSGYYDAHKKELYIKDISDKKAVFQRLLYAMTTKKVDINKYMVGFSITSKQKNSYKYKYENFAINRAVVADLASKLCNTSTEDMAIKILYKTYKANFLGYDILAENDNYYLESNMFKQLCFVTNEKKETIYKLLFERNPKAALEKLLKKSDFTFDKFMDTFDKLSKKYSNYNKVLAYVNTLNSSYAKLQRTNGKTEEDIKKIENKIKKLNNVIKESVKKYSKIVDDEQEINSNEFLENSETEITEMIIKMQDILVEYLTDDRVAIEPFDFASKLQQYNNMIVVKENKVEDLIFETVTTKVLKETEITSVNLIEKIKYSLIREIISTDKYKDIYTDLTFRKVQDTTDDEAYIIVLSNLNVIQSVKISNLNSHISMLKENTTPILTDNFKHILNADYFNPKMGKIEKIFTSIKDRFPYFNKLRMEDINFFEDNGKMHLIMNYKENLYTAVVTENKSRLNIKMVDLSEEYAIFSNRSVANTISLLPVLYKEKKGIFALFSKLKLIFES